MKLAKIIKKGFLGKNFFEYCDSLSNTLFMFLKIS